MMWLGGKQLVLCGKVKSRSSFQLKLPAALRQQRFGLSVVSVSSHKHIKVFHLNQLPLSGRAQRHLESAPTPGLHNKLSLLSCVCLQSKEHPLRFVKASLRAVHRHKSIYCTSSSSFHQSPLIHQQVEQDWQCINKNMLLYLQYFLFIIQVSSQLRWFYIKPQILSVSRKPVSMNEEESVSVKK